jgi:hypothetical protein
MILTLNQSTTPRTPEHLISFRLRLLVCALALGSYALWILAVELIRPARLAFPAAGGIPSTPQQLNNAATAARIGLIRGDLWGDDAIRLAEGDNLTGHGAVQSADKLMAARSATENAVRFAPHDGRLWLLLAAVDNRLGLRGQAALTMSYYTAVNDASLMPLRLLIASRSGALSNPDLQFLVSAEIRTIDRELPELKPAIAAAYRDADAAGRQFIEEAIGTFDPDLLASLRAGASSP